MAEQEISLIKTYRTYVLVWFILLLLLAATVAVAELHLTGLVVLTSISIATCKAGLVAIYFMHLRDEPWVLKAMLIFVLFMLAVLILLTFSDEWFRNG